MTPNIRKRKSHLAEELTKLIADWELCDESGIVENNDSFHETSRHCRQISKSH